MLIRFSHSHERIREMEHELFQSRLKPSVESGSVPEIIRSSSSGLDSHRTAALELLFERSIQKRRERMFTRVKDTSRPDPTLQSKVNIEGSIISTPEVKPTAPAHAPQPPQFSPSDASSSFSTRTRSALVNHETPRDLSNPARKTKVARFEDPPVNARTNSSPQKVIVQLFCKRCGTRQSRKHLRSGVYCGACRGNVQCTGCWAFRVNDTETCTHCYRDFS